MLRPKPTMISLSMKDVTEHLESVDRKASLARASGTINSSRMRQPLGPPRNESTPTMADEPRVVYLNERDTRIHGVTPVPISTDMLHSFDLTIRSRSSAESGTPGAPATTARSLQSLPQDDAENRTQTTPSLEDDSVSLGFLESEPDDSEEPNFIEEDQDSMMTEVPGASPIPRVPRPSLDYRDSSFEGSSRDSSSFGTFTLELSTMDLSRNVTIRTRRNRTPNSRTRLTTPVPEDASTPPAPIPSAVERLRTRHQPLARSPLFRSIDPGQTPMRSTTVGLAPRLSSPGTPSTLFSQPPRSTRTYRQRELTYSYDESENPNAEEVQIWEDDTAEQPMDDDDYYDEDEYYGEEYEEYEGEDEGIEKAELATDSVDEGLEAATAAHAEQAAAIHLDLMMERASLRYREHDSIHDSSTTDATDDMDEALASSPPMYVGQAGGIDRDISRSSRTLVQNLQSTAASGAASRATSVRTVSGLPSSPSLMLPPPFSASPRKVSDNNALPASPAIPEASMMQSSDDDRGRGRTRFPRLGAGGRPSSMDAQVGDSPASPASPYDYNNISQEDGSPSSNASSNRTNVTALTIRSAMAQQAGNTASAPNNRLRPPSPTYHVAVGRPSDIPNSYFTAGRSSELPGTGDAGAGAGASAASLYWSRNPLPSYASQSRHPSPERTQSAVVTRPLPPLPVRRSETASMPPPQAPTQNSPSRDRLWRSNTSPARQVRQPGSPSGTIPSGQWMASSRSTTSDQVDGPPPSPYYTRPTTSRDDTTPGHLHPGRTAFPNLGSFTNPGRPLPPVPQPFIPPVPPGSLTPSAPTSAWRTLTTTPGTRREGRLPALPSANSSRAPPTLPMRLPRTPGRRTPGGATLFGARTPGGSKIRVYNDAITPERQPQTPEDLPESRHRSRYHQNYTMPMEQRNTPRDYRTGLQYSEMRIRRERGRGTRSDSPLGARGGGVESPLGLRGEVSESPLGLRGGGGGREGLGEGVENGNDATLYQRGQEEVRRTLFGEESPIRSGEGSVGVGYWRASGRRARSVTSRVGDEFWEEAENGSYRRLEGGLGRGRSGSRL